MYDQASTETPFGAPVCQVCKTRDETLRAVSYPFVVSIIVVTFQRAFSGIFCRKHQRIYHLLASLITSALGWLGIPFGFIMTPITLLKLARGGVTDDKGNAQLLTAVAEKKLSEGDTRTAIRCFEECLKLQDSPDIRTRLIKLYQIHRTSAESTGLEALWQLIHVPILLLVVSLTGLFIGLFDLVLAILLSPFYENNDSLFVAILSWIPTVTMIFLGVLIMRAMLRWSLAKTRRVSILLGSILAYLSTFLGFYSVLQGQALLQNLEGFFTFFTLSRRDGFFALRSVLTHGGLDALINNFDAEALPSFIFAILLIAGLGLSLFVGLEMVLRTVNGQKRIFQVRESLSLETEAAPVWTWGALGTILFVFLLFLALVFPGKYVNVEKAFQNVSLGIAEMDAYHPDEAVRHFRAMVKVWPDSVTAHDYLGLGYVAQEKYDLAAEEFDTSLKLDANSTFSHLLKAYVLAGQWKYSEAVDEYLFVTEAEPAWGSPHADLAALYYMLDMPQEERREIELALSYEVADAMTYSSIGSYYLATQDFKRAEEYYLKAIQVSSDPEDQDPDNYFLLARVYTSANRIGEAKKAIGEAEKLGANPLELSLSRINLAEFQEQYELASSLIDEAMTAYPNASQLYSERSFVEFQQDKFAAAEADAQKAIALNPYNSQAYVELAFAYHAQGKLTEALEIARKAVTVSRKYDRANYILGLCYMDLAMKDEAIAEFEKFLEVYWERPLIREYKENVDAYLEQLK